MKPLHSVAWISLTAVFAGCGGPEQTCVPGAQVACACSGTEDGTQVCNEDGTALGACDCGDPVVDTDNVAADTDAADTDTPCTEITVGQLEVQILDGGAAMWSAPFSPDVGDHGDQELQLGFVPGVNPSMVGTFDLSDGLQSNYQTCGVCVVAYSNDPAGGLARAFFQKSGTVRVDADPISAEHLTGQLTYVKLQEVTIDLGTYVSTPVPGGACLQINALPVDVGVAPRAWTCGDDTFDDGAVCDCECGAYDPDCAIQNAPVDGCGASDQVCVNATCRPAAANATCATATPLSLGVQVIGSSIYGGNNYDLGLEESECTGLSQGGPDVAYSITLTAGQQVHAELLPGDPALDISLSVVGPGDATVCDAMPLDCLRGADQPFPGEAENLDFTAPSAGTYYLLVDTWQDGGAFTLIVSAP
jgi:hypothetical protein